MWRVRPGVEPVAALPPLLLCLPSFAAWRKALIKVDLPLLGIPARMGNLTRCVLSWHGLQLVEQKLY